ncbi:MAG: N-6 DNA methylase [Nitrospirae bacterium]|nr:N-6 DNA methylase [Nitrospirota bacterium]MBF0591796.1 N-6 DNA methylase [Nitrospirota bacterium]
MELTEPLESATRKEIDRILLNLGWTIREFDKQCNVFTERVRTKPEERLIREKFPNGRFPDYVLYSSDKFEPLAVIEAKRVGRNLEKALKQAREYAECIGAKIIFGVDGSIVEARWVSGNEFLKRDDSLITELLSEKTLLKFVQQDDYIVVSPQKATKTREDLINIFSKTNDFLRNEGMREGIERFTEFSNLLFLKLIDEIERDREENGLQRRMDKRYCWESFCKKEPQDMLDYINDTVLPKLVGKYNHSGDVFSNKLNIQNPKILKQIIDGLSNLVLLDVDSDIKGDAFEYFLKNSVTVGNDLGEYYTPRHIVKLMVDLVNPKFGDKIYDPCCGTGGFLIEGFRHIKLSCNPTEKNIEVLERDTIYGMELTGTSKIAKMNMILAGDGHTNIVQDDSLRNPKKDKFDIILTNFPFSQKTEYASLYKLSSKSANPVFLKHVIDALVDGGTAGVIVPDSVLFSNDTDVVNVRKQLIEACELKAIIQLTAEAFIPYTKQPTTILIFRKGGKTKKIWFFDLENDGFKGSTKRTPKDENDIPLLRRLWSERSLLNEDLMSNKHFTVEYKDIPKDSYKLFLNYYKYKRKRKVKDPIELNKMCKEFVIGHTPDKKNQDFYGDKYLWVTISDMKEKHITNTELKLSEDGASKMGGKKLINKGELLMSFKLTLGKTAFAGQNLFTNEAICSLVLNNEYDTDEIREYLYYVLPLIDYAPYAQRAAKGFTLNKKLIPMVEVPFPDPHSRKRIVDKIKTLIHERAELERKIKENSSEYNKFIEFDIMGN